MFTKVLQVTTLALVAWLVFQFGQTERQLGFQTSLLQQTVSTAEAMPVVQEADPLLTKINTQLTGLAEQQTQQNKAKQQLATYQAQQDKLNTLRKAYILVLEAEAARGQKDGKAAVEKLQASKALIWKSGSHFPEHKKTLQGLMKPIDMTMAAWKGDKLNQDSQAIYSVIQQVLSKQDKK